MEKTASETLGYLFGHVLGIFTGTISFMRRSRVFHSRGEVFSARVLSIRPELVAFHPYATVRFSSALWKNCEILDVFGIAIRFSDKKGFAFQPRSKDQDLLFATFDSSWKIVFSPLLTKQDDYFSNDYFAISPFNTDRLKNSYFKLIPKGAKVKGRSRKEKLIRTIESGQSSLILYLREKNEEWIKLAEIILEEKVTIDQEAMRFNPFLTGLSITPIGFVHYLRIGSYRLSQWARPKQTAHHQDTENASPS